MGRHASTLRSARVVGASLLAVIAQYAVDMPAGYFGPADSMTHAGWIFSIATFAGSVAASAGLLSGMVWAPWLLRFVLVGNTVFFFPPLASDPVISACLIIWQIMTLFKDFFTPELPAFRRGPLTESEAAFLHWLENYGGAAQHLIIVTLIASTALAGFELSRHWIALSGCLLLHALSVALTAPFIWKLFRSGARSVLLAFIPLAGGFAFIQEPAAMLFLFSLYQAAALVLLVRHGQLVADLLDYFFRNPAFFLCFSFALIILLGMLFLSFPAASATDVPISPMDAFFTSASAVCVTGLVVLDTPSAFSVFGQGVILVLIQVGGLGIMVLSAFSVLLIGRSLGLRTQFTLRDILDVSGTQSAIRLTRFIVVSTLAVEAVGAALLAFFFYRHGAELPEAAWKGVFHSISAFCNAGFALQPDSLVMFQHDPAALFVFGALVVTGGLGFSVLAAGIFAARGRRRGAQSLHVKAAVLVTAVLILSGWILTAAFEWKTSMAGLGVVDRAANAFFQAVTPRTAGFNSVDITLLSPATYLLFLVLMFIGASPGGTGGGIKTTTMAVLLSTIPAMGRGRASPVLFRRNIPARIVYKSVAIAVMAAMTVTAGLALLLLTQRLPFDKLLFETVSAFGTVGLSLGATFELNEIGKFIVALVMFIGRVGPLTVALLLEGDRPGRVTYPEEFISVG